MKTKISKNARRLMVVYLAMLPLSQGVWATAPTVSDLNFGTPIISDNFNSLSTIETKPGSGSGSDTRSGQTAYGIFTDCYVGKASDIGYGIYESATPFSSQYLKVFGNGSNLATMYLYNTNIKNKGAFDIYINAGSEGFFGIYSAVDNTNEFSKGNTVVYFKISSNTLYISDGVTGSSHVWQSVKTSLSGLTRVTVIYNFCGSAQTYNGISIANGKAHVYVNGTAVMDGDNPKAFTIPTGRDPYYFRINSKYSAGLSIDDIKIYDALPTAACAYSADLDDNDPSNGSVTWSTTSLTTCNATATNRQVTLTIDPDDGYTLTGFSYSTGDGKVTPNSTNSDSPSLTENSSAAQELTIEFDQNADGDCVANATFSEMVVTDWTWTYNSSALPALLDVYVGQKKQIDVVMSPSGVLTAHSDKNSYSHDVDATYIASPTRAAAYFTFEGKAATDKTTITLTHDDDTSTPKAFQQSVDVRVLALPSVTFTDLVHGETFSAVTATVSADKLTVTTTKKTPTHADVDDPGSSYNTCERGHLHLVGWILSTWADANPGATQSEITSAGSGVYYGTNADIDLVAKNGKTFYAVWGHEVVE